MKPQRLFLSCAVQDLPYAQALRDQLAAAGHYPWPVEIDLARLPTALEPDENRSDLIARSDAFLLLLSPYALASRRVRQEWQMARQQRVPVLLLLIQSVSPLKLLAAMQPCLPGAPPTPDAEMLHWIDARQQPTEAVWKTLAWLVDRNKAQHDLPPAPAEPALFYNEVIPRQARLSAWGQITLAVAGLPIALGVLLWLIVVQLSSTPAIFLDQFFVNLLIVAAGSSLAQMVKVGWNGFETFYRRGRSPGEALSAIRWITLLTAILLLGLGAASHALGKIALLQGRLFPALAMMWGGAFLLLAEGLSLPGWWARSSRTLRMWFPRLVAGEAEMSAAPDALVAPAARGAGAAQPASGRPAHESLASGFLRGMYGAFAGHRVQPAYANAQAGYGLTKALIEPVGQVSVLSAPQDAPFAHSLERYLRQNGVQVQRDASEIVHAHVNARIQIGAPGQRQTGALVLVLSPWTKEVAALNECVHSARAAGAPILPVLIEDTALPAEFSSELWVDARHDLSQARQQVLEAMAQNHPKAPPVAPARAAVSGARRTNPRARRHAAPLSVQTAQWGLFTSTVFKLVLMAILFPMALWMKPTLNPFQWLSAGLLIGVTYIQLINVVLFFMRRLSYSWMLLIQGDCLLTSLVSLPFLQSDLFWPVGPLSWITLLFPLWEAAVFGWLWFVTEIREWALGGFWLLPKLRSLRIAPSTLFYSLAPLLIGLMFLLPVFKNGAAPQLRVAAGRLSPDQMVLVRILPGAQPETWTFKGQAGELATLRVDGGFNSHRLQFVLYRGAQLLAESQATLGGALVSAVRLPEDGEYTIRLIDLPKKGLFRMWLSLERAPLQELKCGAPGEETAQVGYLRPGQSLGWTLRGNDGDHLTLSMFALVWKLDPWLGLYTASGELLISNDDVGWLRNATLHALYLDQAGPYTVIARAQPGTAGPFALTLTCAP